MGALLSGMCNEGRPLPKPHTAEGAPAAPTETAVTAKDETGVAAEYVIPCEGTTDKFLEADTDDSGDVTESEFVEYYKMKTGKMPSSKEWSRFRKADANADGRVSRNEMSQYVAANRSSGSGTKS